MDKRKALIYGGLAIVGAAGIYVVINRKRNENLIAQIHEILDKGTQQSGTPKDIQSDEGFNPGFYKEYAKKHGGHVTLFPQTAADLAAKTIYDSIGSVYDDEEKVVSVIKMAKTKTRLSWVADRYVTKYGKSLGATIANKVDKGNNLEQIYKIVKAMPQN